MRVPYAWHDLVHDRGRTVVAIIGVAFSVLLIFMQIGFFGAVLRTAVLVQDHLDFDLVICSPDYRFLASPGSFGSGRLRQAAVTDGVRRVRALDIVRLPWRAGETHEVRDTAQGRMILVLAIDPADPPLADGLLGAGAAGIAAPDAVLIDTRSRPAFGPQDTGTKANLAGHEVTIAGRFHMGTGFSADGAVILSRWTLSRILPGLDPRAVSLGLIEVDEGSDPAVVGKRLNETLPEDVRALTRDELAKAEREHWITKTSVGFIFGMGALTSLIVGMAIVSQVLSNKVVNHFREYATMKALGYPQRYISAVVLFQAIIVALVGFVPGLTVAVVLYRFTDSYARIPMRIGLLEGVGVLGLAVGMCVVAALVAVRKVSVAAPADLF